MSESTIRLDLKCDSIKSSYCSIQTTGFGWLIDNKKFIVTTHHNLPIKTVNYKDNKLKIVNNCYWNELLLLKSPKLNIKYYNPSLSNYMIPQKDKILTFSDISLRVIDITNIPYNDMPNEPCNIYIVCDFVDKQRDIQGYSGCPVFENNKLIGIQCKVFRDKVLVLPIYYLVKIFQRDNCIYKTLVTKSDILHNVLNVSISYSTFCLLEGSNKDEDIICFNPDYKTKKINGKKLIKYQLNPRFLQLFKKIYFSHPQYVDIMKKILICYNLEKEYYICIYNTDQLELIIP